MAASGSVAGGLKDFRKNKYLYKTESEYEVVCCGGAIEIRSVAQYHGTVTRFAFGDKMSQRTTAKEAADLSVRGKRL
ncbi:hypothetical protein Q5H94_11095 [Sphingomonas sp. CA1-15]|uniref:Uncharacterized protein n=1 Tax=Sphingomonas immobilis TaxID=3063997 RepID=A0ABT8ZZ66_9SPHN|nr:hypothetical protein [Sphingomonas sp. CA1-15]